MGCRFVFLHVSLLLLLVLKVSSNGDQGDDNNDNQGWDGDGNFNNQNPDVHRSCPDLETIVRNITWRRVAANPALPAKLLRLHFHDCIVTGCDGSILLDSTSDNTAEKDALPNKSLAGFDVIDEIKDKLEQVCPNTVSCADVLALAARDAVSFDFQRPMWPVFIGRRDGFNSSAATALQELPSPTSDFATLKQQFRSKGLDVIDLVTLSGAHTIGRGHCVIISKRLFNFTGNGDTDPSIDENYAKTLKSACAIPPNSPSTTVEMDPGSSLSFDSHYFMALNQNMGLFQSDAALLTDPQAAHFANIFENQQFFFFRFARSMVRLGSIGVLGGAEGEIRENCHVINKN